MSVSNVLSPIMVYFDRFVIGAVLSLAAVTYYVTPYEVVTRLWIIPSGLVGVLFPAFAMSLASDSARANQLFTRATQYILIALLPITLTLVTFAPDALRIWLGSEFAESSTGVMRWLALGVLINGLAFVPFTLIQAHGRADLTAKVHLVEIVPYGLMLWFLLQRHGIEGAAMAWTIRVTADACILFAVALRWSPGEMRSSRRIGMLLLMGLASIAIGASMTPSPNRSVVFSVLLVFLLSFSYFVVLDPGDRNGVRKLLRPRTLRLP